MRRRLLRALVAATLAAACGGGSPAAPRAATTFLPDGDGRGPLVVLVPGGGWQTADPSGLEPLARGLAAAGYAAATVTYRAAGDGARFPVPVQDVLCRAAAAVAEVAASGRRHAPLVLVGHSAGGQLAVLAALRPERFRSSCSDPAVTPDAVAGLAGAYDLSGVGTPLFGVPEREDPQTWREGDVHAWVGERPTLPLLLVHGERDQLVPLETTTRLAEALEAAGHPVRTELLPTATHMSVYTPDVVLPVLLDWLAGLGTDVSGRAAPRSRGRTGPGSR